MNNLETKYPELKTMKPSEIFIEWALIVKPHNVIKIYVKKLIPIKEKSIFVKALKLEYNVVRNDNSALDETIELITIEK